MLDRTLTQMLFEEIDRYLAAVDLFRAAGYEPSWRPERAPEALAPVSAGSSHQAQSDVELH